MANCCATLMHSTKCLPCQLPPPICQQRPNSGPTVICLASCSDTLKIKGISVTTISLPFPNLNNGFHKLPVMAEKSVPLEKRVVNLIILMRLFLNSDPLLSCMRLIPKKRTKPFLEKCHFFLRSLSLVQLVNDKWTWIVIIPRKNL